MFPFLLQGEEALEDFRALDTGHQRNPVRTPTMFTLLSNNKAAVVSPYMGKGGGASHISPKWDRKPLQADKNQVCLC